MRTPFRLTGVVLAVFVLNLYVTPSFADWEGMPRRTAPQGEAKVTTVDPQFIPLSEEQEIKKGVKWYWYVLGLAAIGGIAAALSGNKKPEPTSTTGAATGTVTGTW